MCVCMHACMCVCMNACMHVCVCVCMHACIRVRIYLRKCACIYVCMCLSINLQKELLTQHLEENKFFDKVLQVMEPYTGTGKCVCVCMYVCVCVCVCVFLHIHTLSLSLSLTRFHMHVCVCTHTSNTLIHRQDRGASSNAAEAVRVRGIRALRRRHFCRHCHQCLVPRPAARTRL